VRRRILLIEDDDGLAHSLAESLTCEGHDVEVAREAEAGFAKALAWRPDLVLLDLKVPEIGEFDACSEITRRGIAVILLSARSSPADKIRGFDLGADDYVTKPFVLGELLARIRVVLRRAERERFPTDAAHFSDIVVDFDRGRVVRAGAPVPFTQKELELMRWLVSHPGRAFTRDELLRLVWGFRDAPLSRTVDTHIARLRQKLEANPHDPRYFRTVYGVGYAFTP
jgi:DNA-binding response OmpR family regulator